MLGDRRPPGEVVADPKLPLRVDLADYASWLSGHDPFGEDDLRKPPGAARRGQRSLELFLADFCSAYSGGRQVSVEDVQSLLARYPVLLVLDGLDEVPDPGAPGDRRRGDQPRRCPHGSKRAAPGASRSW